MSKPTLVLVHGSWHCPDHFAPLTKNLESHGYKVVLVSLPSTQSPDLPPANLTDDTLAVRNAITAELGAGNNVVVIAHSYGGTPTNNALKDLDETTRKARGESTAVIAITFLCAIPTPAGMSFLDNLGGRPAPLHDLSKVPNFAYVAEPGAHHYFYNDLSEAQSEEWIKMLRPQSWPAYLERTSYAAYNDIPSWYLYCTKDQAIPYEAQKGIVEGAVAAGARIQTKTIDAAHSPWLSKLEQTSEFIRGVAGG